MVLLKGGPMKRSTVLLIAIFVIQVFLVTGISYAISSEPAYRDTGDKSEKGITSEPEYMPKPNDQIAISSEPAYKGTGEKGFVPEPDVKPKKGGGSVAITSEPEYMPKGDGSVAISSEPAYTPKKGDGSVAISSEPAYAPKKGDGSVAITSEPEYMPKKDGSVAITSEPEYMPKKDGSVAISSEPAYKGTGEDKKLDKANKIADKLSMVKSQERSMEKASGAADRALSSRKAGCR